MRNKIPGGRRKMDVIKSKNHEMQLALMEAVRVISILIVRDGGSVTIAPQDIVAVSHLQLMRKDIGGGMVRYVVSAPKETSQDSPETTDAPESPRTDTAEESDTEAGSQAEPE